MRPVSDRFLSTLRGSHLAVFRARVCETFQTGTNPTGTVVPILSGDVTLNATADIRASLDITTDGTGMWPRESTSLLAPYGNELFVERGIQYGNGETEWVSQGYFRINEPEQDEAPDGPIRIGGQDRMAGIVDARLLAPRQFTSATTYGSVVTTLVQEVYPSATIQWDDTTDTQTLGRTLVAEEDRYGFLKDLVTSRGKIFFFDHRGILVIKDPPAITSPVWDVDHGNNGVLVSMSRRLAREGVYNAVVATGESSDTVTPVRAVAYDNNPDSPTYFSGRFGPVPRFYSSPFITTNAQALSAATSLITQALGLPYNVDFNVIPNAALEPFDPIRIRYPARSRSRNTRTETHVIEQLVVPLSAGQVMKASTREKTLVLIGSE